MKPGVRASVHGLLPTCSSRAQWVGTWHLEVARLGGGRESQLCSLLLGSMGSKTLKFSHTQKIKMKLSRVPT